MPFKINNTYMVEKLEDIPVDLKIGSQVILIEQFEDNETQMDLDQTTNMILECIEMGAIYKFSVNVSRPEFYLDQDRFSEIKEKMGEDVVDDLNINEYNELAASCTECIDYEESRIRSIEMIKVGNKLYPLQIDKNGKTDLSLNGYGLNNNPNYKWIFERIFDWSYNYIVNQRTYSQENMFHQYLHIPIGKSDITIVFMISHEIYPDFHYWHAKQKTFLIEKEGNMIEIKSPMKYIYNLFKEYKNYQYDKKEFEKFDEVIFASEYDIDNFIKDEGKGLYRVKNVFLNDDFKIYQTLDKFYSPYFKNEDVKVYPNSIRNISNNTTPHIVKDGKDLGWRGEKDYPDFYRIGKALITFNRNKGYGLINPKTGESCDEKIKIFYKDDEGIVTNSYSQLQHYIKISGFFIKPDMNYEGDEEAVRELTERFRLVKMLSESV